MVTRKDIAREAGVAQGTVSNVLNGKGNVSSDKILRVEQACAKLGYTINQRAKTLRQGYSRLLAVVLPNMLDRRYTDFFSSFKYYAESLDYSVCLYLSNDITSTEESQLQMIRSEMAAGIATFSTCVADGKNIYKEAGIPPEDVVFVERNPFNASSYIGFDYKKAGTEMASSLLSKKCNHLLLITENLNYTCQQEFYQAFTSKLRSSTCQMIHLQTDAQHCYTHFLQTLNDNDHIDAVVVTNYHLAENFRDIIQTFYPRRHPSLYTISPLLTIPTGSNKKYELNYRLMGRCAAERLINRKEKKLTTVEPLILNNDGLRSWIAKVPGSKCKQLTLLALDSPTSRIMENMAHLYTDATGIKVKVAICSYDGIHEILSGLGNLDAYDVIRLDHTWLPWFGERIFAPLNELTNIGTDKLFEPFISGLVPRYTSVNGVAYALPQTPSAQLLFYRKDLFENAILQRLYKEKYREDLVPPKDFASYNQIAKFFTKRFNDHSPTTYGTTLTLGNSGVAATEYLTRYFSHSQNLFDASGNLMLDTDVALQAMNELIEAKAYAPKRYNSWWRETAREFSAGDTAMTILFSNYAAELLDSTSSITNNIGYTYIPGQNALLGGGCIGVCKSSSHKQEALDFIRWLCSEEISTAMTLLGSVSPCEKTYSNYEVLDTYPWLGLSHKCIAQSKINRIPAQKVNCFDERRFLSILGMAVNNTYNETATAQEALTYAIDIYNRTMR